MLVQSALLPSPSLTVLGSGLAVDQNAAVGAEIEFEVSRQGQEFAPIKQPILVTICWM